MGPTVVRPFSIWDLFIGRDKETESSAFTWEGRGRGRCEERSVRE